MFISGGVHAPASPGDGVHVGKSLGGASGCGSRPAAQTDIARPQQRRTQIGVNKRAAACLRSNVTAPASLWRFSLEIFEKRFAAPTPMRPWVSTGVRQKRLNQMVHVADRTVWPQTSLMIEAQIRAPVVTSHAP